MNYQSPKGLKKEAEKRIVISMPIVEGENNATLALMERFPEVTAYGMLLLGDPQHPMATLVRERWAELDNLTGNRFVLFVFERPEEWTQSYLRYWQHKLGDDFERTWKQWQEKEEPGAAYGYLDLFKPALQATQLPCLVLFTDAKKREVVVRPIPDWDQDRLFQLLVGIAATVQASAEQPETERLEWLQNKLTAPGPLFLAQAGHVGSLAMAYFKEHPALVTSTALSVVLAMSGAGLLTLPTTVIAALNIVKETMAGGK